MQFKKKFSCYVLLMVFYFIGDLGIIVNYYRIQKFLREQWVYLKETFYKDVSTNCSAAFTRKKHNVKVKFEMVNNTV